MPRHRGNSGQPQNSLPAFDPRHAVCLTMGHIWFDPLGQWKPIHTFNHKADGASRKHPYRVRGRWHLVGNEPALLVFCPASQTPLGSISTAQKRELGAIVAKVNRPT